jgi:hypothetical protein
LDLPTHFFFGIAVGLVFFGQPFVALIIGLGALLPDLDREYWYVPEQKYAEEQMHRALFHNVVVMAATYLVSPLLSLGVFLHVLQDSFTTVKDRGVEWFYPFTRFVKRGTYDADGNVQSPSPNEHVYFYQEDPPGLVKLADPDLQEPAKRPVPWRRAYGFAQNSHLLDRGFLFGSVGIAVLWLVDPVNSGSVSHFFGLGPQLWGIAAGYIAVALLFVSGETQSSLEKAREKAGQLGKPDPASRLRALKPIQVPLLVLGLALFAAPAVLYWSDFVSNVDVVLSDPPLLVACIALVLLIATAVIRWQTRGGRTTVV